MKNCQYDYEDYRNKTPIETKFPFSSARKRMSLIFYDPNTSRRILLVKGASELVLEGCTKFHSFDGGQLNMDNFLKVDINHAIEGVIVIKSILNFYKKWLQMLYELLL